MHYQSLNGLWSLDFPEVHCAGTVPGSVYSFLLDAGLMEDPFYRENELQALALMENDFTFSRRFTAEKPRGQYRRVFLRCEGLDTLCTLTLNGKSIAQTDNMHRAWEFDVTDLLCDGENELTALFASPTRFIREAYEKDPIGGSTDAMRGFPHLRKAHCMFGWDWGAHLPDAGIWRDIALVYADSSRLEDILIAQNHEDGKVSVQTSIQQSGDAVVAITITAPDGTVLSAENGVPCPIADPQLWWPNGYGAQPLYTVRAELLENGVVVDSTSRRIGLRTMTVTREQDEWGEGFAQTCNGMPFFAMGADYIPEDNVLARVTPERTRILLEQCVAANFNSVRVWGGGYYPNDFFFDICDELGLVVWQDFMFACANYRLTEHFEENIKAEAVDNVRRLRHHASLGLWCGNNEMEMFQAVGEYSGDHKTRSDYIRMFEHILPEIMKKEDPYTFYWPASPSSGGGFDAPNDPNRGDVHYWEVWHGMKPFADYRNYFFRYASEFGFQSFPSLPTLESFTLPEDRNIFSRVMERHQRNGTANGRIMNYLSATYLYPSRFDVLLYASQLLQAEAIRYGVEHWRRNRGRCMGAIYWQLNDIWPVASWASIDSLGRWKALHYYAKRFFAPVMISCEEIGEMEGKISINDEPAPTHCRARISVANEQRVPVTGTVRWQLCDAAGNTLRQGAEAVTVAPLTSLWLDTLDFADVDSLANALVYTFESEGDVLSAGSVLFTNPKHFHWQNPALSCVRRGDSIIVSSSAYAKSVEIYAPDEADLVLSDNFFDMAGGEKTVQIIRGNPQDLRLRSVYDIR